MFVLENENEDPFTGEFEFRGQLTDATNKWVIDGTVFEHPLTNNLYFIWSEWQGDVDGMQVRYYGIILSFIRLNRFSVSYRFFTSLTCPARIQLIQDV